MTRYIDHHNQELLMNTAVVDGDFVLASGRKAKQKFEFDNISANSQLLKMATAAVSRCIQNEYSQPDAIVTVARGATCMGGYLESMVGRRHVRTDYIDSENGKQFYILDDIQPGEEVVVIDDVYTSGTNSGKVIDELLKRGAVPVGVAVLLNRSEDISPRCRSLPVSYVIHYALS